MEEKISIKSDSYDIPAVLSSPNMNHKIPAVILCHGTGSSKNEVGNIFIKLSKSLNELGIASLRFDFAGCGCSLAKEQELTFYGEVNDTQKVYSYLSDCEKIDSNRIGILGFSQGARVMSEFIGKYPEKIKVAVSWSGACHNGAGVFEDWFQQYYHEATINGYAKIPMSWRKDLILSKGWFDDILNSNPLDGLSKYKGAMLAISGSKDELVPYMHAKEIASACKGEISEYKIIENANHTFNILEKDKSLANRVIKDTVAWIDINI
jgi:dienelactone hydrolase